MIRSLPDLRMSYVCIDHSENDPTCPRYIVVTTTASSHSSSSRDLTGPSALYIYPTATMQSWGLEAVRKSRLDVRPVSLCVMLLPVPFRKLNSEIQDPQHVHQSRFSPVMLRLHSCYRDSPRGYIGMLDLRSASNNKHTLAFSLTLAPTRTHTYLTTMKFATTSSIILLAFSLVQLAYTLPVPVSLPDAPYKRTANESGEVPHYLSDRTDY